MLRYIFFECVRASGRASGGVCESAPLMAPLGGIVSVRRSILNDVHALANKLQKALGPSETLQDFCARHFTSSQVQEYARAGMWPASRRVSIPYQDDKYKYVHIHLFPADLQKVQGRFLTEPEWRALDPDGFPSVEGHGWEHQGQAHEATCRARRSLGGEEAPCRQHWWCIPWHWWFTPWLQHSNSSEEATRGACRSLGGEEAPCRQH